IMRRQGGQKREADQSLGGRRTIRTNRKRTVAFAAADCFDAELDRGRARCAGGRKRDRHAAGAIFFGKLVRNACELALVETLAFIRITCGIKEAAPAALAVRLRVKAQARMPVKLDRRSSEKQRTAEIG